MPNLETILPVIGILGIILIVFAESGLLIGFFLPGDSLLFTAGFLASQGVFDIWTLSILSFIAAVVGDSVGYGFGHKVGRRLFNKTDSIFFHKDHLMKAEKFYEKHGKKTIVLARFMPIVRTFAPIVAGIGKMEYKTFIVYNIIGGLAWAMGLTWVGFILGNSIPNVDRYLLPIIALIVILSILPQTIHILKDPHHRRQIKNLLKKIFNRE